MHVSLIVRLGGKRQGVARPLSGDLVDNASRLLCSTLHVTTRGNDMETQSALCCKDLNSKLIFTFKQPSATSYKASFNQLAHRLLVNMLGLDISHHHPWLAAIVGLLGIMAFLLVRNNHINKKSRSVTTAAAPYISTTALETIVTAPIQRYRPPFSVACQAAEQAFGQLHPRSYTTLKFSTIDQWLAFFDPFTPRKDPGGRPTDFWHDAIRLAPAILRVLQMKSAQRVCMTFLPPNGLPRERGIDTQLEIALQLAKKLFPRWQGPLFQNASLSTARLL